MIPNTRDTIRRIRKTSMLSESSSAGSETEHADTVIQDEPTDTFMSSDFRNMYASPDKSILNYRVGDSHSKEYSYTYPFEEAVTPNALPETFDASAFYSKPCTVNICMYRICKGSHTFPYLQFKLRLDSKKSQLVFPTFSFQFKPDTVAVAVAGAGAESNSRNGSNEPFLNSGCVKRANEYITQWLKGAATDSIEFRGIYHFQKQYASSTSIMPGLNGGKRKCKNEIGDDRELSDRSSESSESEDYELDPRSKKAYANKKDAAQEQEESLYLVY